MKRKLITTFGFIALLFNGLSLFAYDFEADGFFYNVINQEGKEVEVTYKTMDYNSYSGVVNIPSTASNNGETYNVTRIGRSAFRNCTSLISVTIPNTVTNIGEEAFYNCTNIRSLTIGSSITNIGSKAFYFYGIYNQPQEQQYTIPKVIWLGNTPPVGSSEISASINYVSNNEFSFYGQKVYPFLSSRFEVDNVVYVPVSPSERTCDVIDCNYAPTSTVITIDNIVKNKNIELKVLEVNNYSFYKNKSITKLIISNKGNIGNYAFYDCNNLLTADLSNLGNIGNYGFYNCKNLNSVTIGNKVTEIGNYAFDGCSLLSEINLPDNITSLGKYAFSECSSLNNAFIGSGVTMLPRSIFSGCSSLSSLTIPANILGINNYAFSGCRSLRDIKFLQQQEKESKSFPNWTSTNYSSNSTSSHEYEIDVLAGDVLSFEIWTNSNIGFLEVYINDTEIAWISSSNEIISRSFSSAQTIILKVSYKIYFNETGSYSDHAGIRNIALNDPSIALGSNGKSPLFSDCPLDEVVIGRKLSYNTSSNYGYSPFYRNTSLRSVKISDIEDTVYDNEFYGCSNLQEFECGDGVTSIGNWAFSGCSALKSYISGTSVESIGQEAFSDCTAMTSFTTNAAVPPVCGNQALDDINKWECTLHVPQESIDYYQAAEQWKEFFFIETSGVEDVIADNEDYSECPVEIYNLSGNKVGSSKERLSPGIYIMRQGRKVEKIMIQ